MGPDDLTARIDRDAAPDAGTYGDRRAREGGAQWALWELDSGRVLPGRYGSFAEAEAARAGRAGWVACLQYAWDGGD